MNFNIMVDVSHRYFLNIFRELQDRFKSFAQFHSSREHDQFIQNLVKEKELKFRLQECYKYRRNGITRAEECVEFERMKSRKKLQIQNAASTGTETPSEGQVNGALPSVSEQSSAEVMEHIVFCNNNVAEGQFVFFSCCKIKTFLLIFTYFLPFQFAVCSKLNILVEFSISKL